MRKLEPGESLRNRREGKHLRNPSVENTLSANVDAIAPQFSHNNHALERTSPKGEPFLGRCIKCGALDLPPESVTETCPNTSGMDHDTVLNRILNGGSN